MSTDTIILNEAAHRIVDARALLRSFAVRGIRLTVERGELIAAPAALLEATDRHRLAEAHRELTALLTSPGQAIAPPPPPPPPRAAIPDDDRPYVALASARISIGNTLVLLTPGQAIARHQVAALRAAGAPIAPAVEATRWTSCPCCKRATRLDHEPSPPPEAA